MPPALVQRRTQTRAWRPEARWRRAMPRGRRRCGVSRSRGRMGATGRAAAGLARGGPGGPGAARFHGGAAGLLGLGLLALLGAFACRQPGTAARWVVPALTWRVESRTSGKKRVFTADGEIKARPGESFILALDAVEPHGIRRVRLEGSGRYSCVAGGAGASHVIVEPSHEQELERDENGQAINKVSLLRVVDTAAWTCEAGAFAGGELVFDALAENYTGGLTESHLVIRRFR